MPFEQYSKNGIRGSNPHWQAEIAKLYALHDCAVHVLAVFNPALLRLAMMSPYLRAVLLDNDVRFADWRVLRCFMPVDLRPRPREQAKDMPPSCVLKCPLQFAACLRHGTRRGLLVESGLQGSQALLTPVSDTPTAGAPGAPPPGAVGL
jgi:hypothetical protein